MATLSLDQHVDASKDRATVASHATVGTDRLDTIQLLRALAAVMVVLLHAQTMVRIEATRAHVAFPTITGFPLGAGVDLFFVISGFIIVVASEKLFGHRRNLEFLRRRVLRIVPLFWFALCLRLIVLAVASAAGQRTFPRLTVILASFFFIPCDGMGFGPAYPFPILDLGWSLNFEMLFYALMACLIGLRRERAVGILVAVLMAAALAATMKPPANVALRFWSHPLTVEFGIGALLALAYRRGVRLPAPARLMLVLCGIAWWILLPLSRFENGGAPGSYSWTRVATDGGGAILLVAAATLGTSRLRGRAAQALIALGDSSYSLYLIHPFVMLVLTHVVRRIAPTPAALWPSVIGSVAVAVAVAHALHRRVERPVIRRLQRLTDRQRPPRRIIVDG